MLTKQVWCLLLPYCHPHMMPCKQIPTVGCPAVAGGPETSGMQCSMLIFFALLSVDSPARLLGHP